MRLAYKVVEATRKEPTPEGETVTLGDMVMEALERDSAG
jgi:hypothetical protein